MIRVAIVGGGISGLSAAFYLDKARRAGAQLNYTLFESSDRLGGVIQTERRGDFIIEAGPDSFLSSKPWAAELARELNIADQLIGSNDATRKTYVLLNRRLVPMPDGLQMIEPAKILPIVFTPFFSLTTKLRMLSEYLFPPAPLAEDKDESVASFVDRHFGGEVTRKLAAPLLAGVYGGDADRLSVRAVLPRFVELEAAHRSLVRGVVAAKPTPKTNASSPIFSTFKVGMQQLIDAVTGRLEAGNIRLACAVDNISRANNDWRLHLANGQSMTFDRVILALPAYAAAQLLRQLDAPLAATLDEIPYSSSVTVTAAFDEQQLPGVTFPPGFGFLVPRSEKIPLIACTFVQNKFNYRTPKGSALLRCFMPEAIDWSGERIHAVVTQEIKSILGITAPPRELRIFRWPRSMPQYEVGHLDRVAAIQNSVAMHGGLQLIGNAYRGIGVPDCVRDGKDAAGLVMKSIFAQ